MASHSLSNSTLSTSIPSLHSRTAQLRPNSISNSFLGTQFSLPLTTSRPLTHNLNTQFSPFATISFSLPTAKPERVSTEKAPKWSERSIKAFAMGELEARKLKFRTMGTEAILMGILVEGTSLAAKFLRANGVTLLNVRDEAIKLLGKSDMFTFIPEHPSLTESTQRVLDNAIDEKLKSGDSGEITTTHLLLGIWSEKEAAGHKIMTTLGFTDEKIAEIAKSKDEE